MAPNKRGRGASASSGRPAGGESPWRDALARFAYNLLLWGLTPLLLPALLWRLLRQPAYRSGLAERFGFYGPRPEGEIIWIHAVSVGETHAARPLIEALQARWPQRRILLTGMTPTGRAAARQVYGERVLQAYLPYDHIFTVDRFFRHFSPVMGILMETEIWPNLIHAAARHEVPVLLANARLSERSARRYRRFSALVRPVFARLAGVAAQTGADAQRLSELGAGEVGVCGNLKFDVRPSTELLSRGEDWRRHLSGRPVWLAASTREGEEARILDAWKRSGRRDVLLVIVPRHPQRFEEVAGLIAAGGLPFSRRGECLPRPEDAVWLGDSMGELAAYYRMADLAYIGGSLLPLGGQNLIEAAACGCPALIGPHTFNFAQASEDAISAGAACRVDSAEALVASVLSLLESPSRLSTMRRCATEYAGAHQGAAARMLEFIVAREAARR